MFTNWNKKAILNSTLSDNNSIVSLGLFNCSELKSADMNNAARLSTGINFSEKLLFAALILKSIGDAWFKIIGIDKFFLSIS